MSSCTRFIAIVVLVFSFLKAHAATSITTPTVSGHWTTTGSPYYIFNHVKVATDSSLVIDPGVTVSFRGAYQLRVDGVLKAVGTAANPITFTAHDTAGWSTVPATSVGGWLGIYYAKYMGTTPDSSEFSYCNVSCTKFCLPDYLARPDLGALLVTRPLAIKNSNFFNNRCNESIPVYILNFSTANTSGTVEVAGCSVYNNIMTSYPCIGLGTIHSGNINFHDCKIYGNTGNTALYCGWVNLLFERNEVYENKNTNISSGLGTLTFYGGGNVKIRRNKLHHNTNHSGGAIFSLGGFLDIDNNLICNNTHTSGSCGITDGGGGLNLTRNGVDDDSTLYNVRNNIIANNYSPFHGGGINLYHADANVVNNHIVNNSAPVGSAICMLDDSLHLVSIRNNMIFGNVNTLGLPQCIEGFGKHQFKFDHNFMPGLYTQDVALAASSLVSAADTTTNITGINPGMTAPTLTSSHTESALLANFTLLSTSVCIDKGDNSAVISGALDYFSKIRVHNGTVDIGADEYGSLPAELPVIAGGQRINVYPNPAKNTLNVVIPGAQGKVYLLDLAGRIVVEKELSGELTLMDVSAISRGTYVLIFVNDEGEKTALRVSVE